MFKKLTIATALAGVMTGGIMAAPATAQDYYGSDGYHQSYRGDDGEGYDQGRYDQDARYQNYRQQREYQRYQQQRRAQYERQYQRDGYQGYDRGQSYDRGQQDYAYGGGAYPRHRTYYQGQQCRSGTTGTILGAVAGGLLGREIGRGGRYDRPSTTGLILGAGGGALAGRAIERSGNDCR